MNIFANVEELEELEEVKRYNDVLLYVTVIKTVISMVELDVEFGKQS